MTFQLGQPKPPGTGRAVGTPNKITTAMIKAARDILCGDPERDPLAAAFRMAGVLEGMTQRRLANFGANAAQLPINEFKVLCDGIAAAADINLRCAEFARPKLRRVENYGDVPAAGPVNVQNRVTVTLNIGQQGEQRTVLPVIEQEPLPDVRIITNGGGDTE